MASPVFYVRSLIIAGCSGVLAVVAGILVLAGWLTENTALRQIRSDWTPMVPMTAVAFCLSGSALLAITATMNRGQADKPLAADRWRKAAIGFALLVAVIGGR